MYLKQLPNSNFRRDVILWIDWLSANAEGDRCDDRLKKTVYVASDCVKDELVCGGGSVLMTSGAITTTVAGVKTIFIWFNPDTASADLIDIEPGASQIVGSNFQMSSNDAVVTFFMNGELRDSYNVNRWNFLSITIEAGIEISTIGSVLSTGDYSGKLGPIIMFNKVLTQDEIRQYYNATNPYKDQLPSPLDFLGGVVTWYDASDTGTIATSSGKVTTWSDKSGMGIDATQGTDALRPTFDSGVPGIKFDGADDFLSVEDNAVWTMNPTTVDATFSFVINLDTYPSLKQPVFFRDTVGAVWAFLQKGGSDQYMSNYDGGGVFQSTNIESLDPVNVETKYHLMWHYDSSLLTYFKDNDSTHTGSDTLTNNNSLNPSSLSLGGMPSSATNCMDGRIYEVVITKTAITSDQRLKLQNYYTKKWGF